VQHRFGSETPRLLLLVAFALVANSTAIHALARAAHSEDDSPAANPTREGGA
jgi:multisubunit Na+/H+ antiporter MnhG subunit